MINPKELLDMLEEEEKDLKGWEAISLLARIRGWVKSMETSYIEGLTKQEGENGLSERS